MSRLTVRNFAARLRELPSSVEEPEQDKSAPYLDVGSRWEPCHHFYKAGVPYKVWTEQDVFHFHGLHKYRDCFPDPYAFQTSDIAILVNDLEGAAAILEGSGYFRTPKSSEEQDKLGYSGSGQGNREFIRLLNVSVMVRHHSQWDSFEEVTNKVVYAAGLSENHQWGPAQVAGNGVLLMLASDWNYTLNAKAASPYYHDPIPELSEYFNSHVSIWMDTPISPPVNSIRSPGDTAKLRHCASVLKGLICEADDTWTVEFEEDIKSQHRQALFDLLEMCYRWMMKEGVCMFTRLTTDVDFQKYSKDVRGQIKAGVHDPVLMADFNRCRMKGVITMPLPRGQASTYDEKRCKKDLPRLSWLVRAPRGDGWFLLSLNVARILENKRRYKQEKQEKLTKPDHLPSRQRQPKRTEDDIKTLEYYLQDILADTDNWAFQNQEF